MSRSTRQFAAHMEARGKALPRAADVTGAPWPHLRKLGAPSGGTAARPLRANPRGQSQQLVALAPDQLADLIRAAVAEALSEGANDQRPALLDRLGLARALGIGLATVDRLRRDGMPCVHVGDSPRFEIAPCLAWLRGREVAP